MTRKGNMKVAETSPTIKKSRTAKPPDTGTAAEVDVPRIVLRDITKGTVMLGICITPHLNIPLLSIPFVYDSTF